MSKRLAKRTASRKTTLASASDVHVTGAQLRAARALLKISQRELSALSRVSNLTIVRMEATEGRIERRATLVAAIVMALARKGVQFLSPGRIGQGVLLRRQK